MIDSAAVMSLSEEYGRFDGDICYRYAFALASVYSLLSTTQQLQLVAIAVSLGYMADGGTLLADFTCDGTVCPSGA